MGNTASPEASPTQGDPIFKATGLDHVLLNVSDPEKSALFYAKVFGPVTQRNNNRIWFQVGKSRVGLLKTPEGQRPGVNHYCVAAENVRLCGGHQEARTSGGQGGTAGGQGRSGVSRSRRDC